jgi:hypothetical protein
VGSGISVEVRIFSTDFTTEAHYLLSYTN